MKPLLIISALLLTTFGVLWTANHLTSPAAMSDFYDGVGFSVKFYAAAIACIASAAVGVNLAYQFRSADSPNTSIKIITYTVTLVVVCVAAWVASEGAGSNFDFASFWQNFWLLAPPALLGCFVGLTKKNPGRAWRWQD